MKPVFTQSCLYLLLHLDHKLFHLFFAEPSSQKCVIRLPPISLAASIVIRTRPVGRKVVKFQHLTKGL